MSDLSKILKEEYDKQKSTITTQSLMEMIEEMMNLQEAFGLVVEGDAASPRDITITYKGLPQINISELGWANPDGEPAEIGMRNARERMEVLL